jgi:starch synthase (maltosyl-transferring)
MQRILIENVLPSVEHGKYPSRTVIGGLVTITCDIICHGAYMLDARIRYKHIKERNWRYADLELVDNDMWRGNIKPEKVGMYSFIVEAWIDTISTKFRDAKKWLDSGENISSDIISIKSSLKSSIKAQTGELVSSLIFGLEKDPVNAVSTFDRESPTGREARYLQNKESFSESDMFSLYADPEIAGYASWYELFPRSQGSDTSRSGTLRDCIERLPDIKEMGFNVLYLTPIFPIGKTNRVGKNGNRPAKPDDPGSTWAIGNSFGGHKTINPDLGTMEDFDELLATARSMNIDIALDIAFQCSPDHPYVKDHPEWFSYRPDGTIRYAENPPKKYFDIYPLNFDIPNPMPLWRELRSIFEFWISHGVKIFRVDNPHTKPLDFWNWCLNSLKRRHPDTVFLAEAFTRPKLMYALSKAGFNESYTYFTWRNYDYEIKEYITELSSSPLRNYFRPMFFVNTPDILPYVLQHGGRNAFILRAVLAATLSPLWGMYSGYELCENTPIPEKEEYLNSEKYEIKKRDWKAPGNIRDIIARLNAIRSGYDAFRGTMDVTFLVSSNPNILFYMRRNAESGSKAFVAVNINPFEEHTSRLSIPANVVPGILDSAQWFKDIFLGTRILLQGREFDLTLAPGRKSTAILIPEV